ncbi:hypothetical protein HAX54_045992, partial [Datura stramonium]|nr:hypothetical protein [Datura stramonium]
LRAFGGGKRQQTTLWGPTVALTFNFFVSVSIILMNKLVLVTVGFNYPIFLSFLHYVCSWLIMAILNALSILSLSTPSKSTKYSSLLSLGIVMSLSTGLANITSTIYFQCRILPDGKDCSYTSYRLAEFVLFEENFFLKAGHHWGASPQSCTILQMKFQ